MFTDWDVRKDDKIEYFDPELSYELTGYRPITDTKGLDFLIDEFIQAREAKLHTGRYSGYIEGSKQYADFWDGEIDKCYYGFTNSQGYTITGDHYYFLNYYQLPLIDKDKKGGSGRYAGFPYFIVEQYKYFHYMELCRHLKLNCIGLKSRGVGWSEIAAATVMNSYTNRYGSRSMVTAQTEFYTKKLLKKCWDNMTYVDTETEGGMRHLRQVKNTEMYRRASALTKDGNEEGTMSEIEGVVANEPGKIRGDRCDVIMYEEAGSWPDLITAWVQGSALTELNGEVFGIKMAWGTGGDKGKDLEGLAEIFNNPANGYDCLPYKHNYTNDGNYVLTGFFVPAYNVVFSAMDHRGYTDPEKGKEYYNAKRSNFIDPNKLVIYCAEFCFTPEDAFALEGINDFNKVLLTEQSAMINIHKSIPEEYKPKNGFMEYIFKANKEEPAGVRFVENPNGKVIILEHPQMEEGQVPERLYVAGIDGIDSGMNETSSEYKDPSQFCIVIKRRAKGLQEPMYVAMYKDRPQRIEEAYKIAMKLLEYYNCKACLESTKIGFLGFLKSRKLADKYLMKRPTSTQPTALITKGRKPNGQYGTPAPANVVHHYLELIAEFVEDYAHTMWIDAMVRELLTYNYDNKRKFDIVAALGMCELADEDMYGIKPKAVEKKGSNAITLGFWCDYNGIKHFGKKPANPYEDLSIEELDGTNTYSSDPRVNAMAKGDFDI